MSLLYSCDTPADDAALDAAGSDYFGMSRVDWSGAEESVIQRDLITREGKTLKLTDDGAAVAERRRADHPKHLCGWDAGVRCGYLDCRHPSGEWAHRGKT